MTEPEKPNESLLPDVSRREFLATVGVGVASAAVLPTELAAAPIDGSSHEVTEGSLERVPITLQVNGNQYALAVEPRWTLATVLRRELGLTGTKVVCDRGECGGCTVVRNGQLIYSCMTLAVECDQASIETVEGVASAGTLHPVQRAFIEHDAMQCGYCTPGMVMSVKHFLDGRPNPSIDEMKEAISGNLCRCGTYPNVLKAALSATGRLERT